MILPEALLATKEVNEKSRTAAFQLLLAMGRRMRQLGAAAAVAAARAARR